MTGTGLSVPLRVGTRVDHDGARFVVVELAGRHLLLQQVGTGGLRQVDLAWLLAHPSTRLVDADPSAAVAVGVLLDDLDEAGRAEVASRVAHVREVLTGYQLGSAELALPGEPRVEYGAGATLTARYAAKAAELGVAPSTVRRWSAAFRECGPVGLVRESTGPKSGRWGRTDPRWIDMCHTVLAGHVTASRPTRAIILAEITCRLAEQYGAGVVASPAKTLGYELLREMTRGSNAFDGSTKGKRSIADRPPQVYGRLRATRPGEYVLLDTNRLDVFAMEPLTCQWVQCELTAAMDLYDRCICGLRLTPVSTKALDVAGVLYETVHPRALHDQPVQQVLPAHGVPGAVVLDSRKLVDAKGRPLLPSVAAETIVYDHGQIYVSEHVESVCARFGISLQPARPGTPTDKSPLERWFRTLADGLLVALPGYKGADVHSRGLDVEQQSFFFLDELETIIREWTNLVYHRRPHRGLCIPEVPGLDVSPLEMFAHGVTRAGYLSVPARPDLAYDFLDTQWTSIQHYGVQINGLRYDGKGLNGLRNSTSPYTGVHAGRWPIAVDPGDVRAVYFQRPDDHQWHRLDWEHAPALGQPFSSEAVTYARQLATRTQRFPDLAGTLLQLLERWGAGLTDSATERRMAIRLSQDRLRLLDPATTTPGEPVEIEQEVSALPSVRRLTAIGSAATAAPGPGSQSGAEPPTPLDGGEDLGGDDDEDADLDDGDNFYADIMDIS
jgi:transposase InsO family protein